LGCLQRKKAKKPNSTETSKRKKPKIWVLQLNSNPQWLVESKEKTLRNPRKYLAKRLSINNKNAYTYIKLKCQRVNGTRDLLVGEARALRNGPTPMCEWNSRPAGRRSHEPEEEISRRKPTKGDHTNTSSAHGFSAARSVMQSGKEERKEGYAKRGLGV
jgi:hypothetical protein